MLPDDTRAELEAPDADMPPSPLEAPEDVLAERDAEVRALSEEPFNDAERPAGIEDLKARYDGD